MGHRNGLTPSKIRRNPTLTTAPASHLAAGPIGDGVGKELLTIHAEHPARIMIPVGSCRGSIGLLSQGPFLSHALGGPIWLKISEATISCTRKTLGVSHVIFNTSDLVQWFPIECPDLSRLDDDPFPSIASHDSPSLRFGYFAPHPDVEDPEGTAPQEEDGVVVVVPDEPTVDSEDQPANQRC